MKYLITIALTCGIALSNCTKETAATTTTITVSLDTCIVLSNVKPGWNICFDSVTNESRCPANANCIWEGYASIKLSLQTSADSSQFILNTHVSNSNLRLRNDTTINGVNIRLVNLSPYPGLEDGITRYRAELGITK